YVGPDELRAALEQNQAAPLSLASADFDEDGVPDLISGYSYNRQGIVTLLRGNVDSIYPNAPEAQQRRANGTFTEAPFLSPARVFESPVAADFIGAGDFDADGHWDVVIGSRTRSSLYLLSGDGYGNLSLTKEIPLPGAVTAMTTGEINRADGLTDIVVGVVEPKGASVQVFEGPEGALRAQPEVFEMAAQVSSLALGQLDNEYTMDLAVAAGNELIVLAGRDRKLSLDEGQQAEAAPAVRSQRTFDSKIKSLALGDFTAGSRTDLALLTEDGVVQLRSPGEAGAKGMAGERTETWNASVETFRVNSPSAQLLTSCTSAAPHDDLLIADAANNQLQILTSEGSDATAAEIASADNTNLTPVPLHLTATLDVASAPVAVLPMRLNGDALSDLTVLTNGTSTVALIMNQPEATFVVTNTNANGPGSLLFAMADANETPGADTITFNIPGSAPFVINQTVQLPTVTDPVTIDGTTQPGFAGTPVIELVYPSFNGLQFNVGNNTFRGIAMTASGPALEFQTGGNNVVEGNFLGTNISGTQTNGNGDVRIHTSNNRIGGTVPAARNLAQVILIGQTSSDAGGNVVLGNFLGVNVNGTGGGAGRVLVTGGPSNIIGGTVAGARNVISLGGTGGSPAVAISTSGTDGNLIQGNYVGTDVSGTVSSGSTNGIFLDSVAATVGGTTPAARNLVSGTSSLAGIQISTPASGPPIRTNLVQGNFLGTNVNGNGDLGNGGRGILIDGFIKRGTTIGGTAAGAGNVIANNKGSGIDIATADGGVTVQGNFIGTDATGTLDLGNLQNGIYIHNSPNNVIGGLDVSARNVISGNGLSGVLIEGAQSTGNSVLGNFIGTNAAGTSALGNDLNGVTTSQAPNNTIGGSTPAARNIISSSGRHGVSIGIDTQSGSTGITVSNNYIGTDVSGNNCLGNLRDGVFVNRGSVSHTITDNLITCNQRNGVNIPNFATNDPGIRIEVTNNSIYANAALGIDLGDPGISPNKPGGPFIGEANLHQNFPLLTSFSSIARADEGSGRANGSGPDAITVNATLNSVPNTTFTVHWYFSSDAQCVTSQETSRPLVSGKVPGVTTNANGDAQFNFPLDLPAGLTKGIVNCTATDPQGNTSEFSSCLAVNAGASQSPSVQLDASSYSAAENIGSKMIAVTRTGNTSAAATVDYATSDSAGTNPCSQVGGAASSRCDYETTVGTLRFAAGESSKTISIPIVDDAWAEGAETFTITLSNVSGGTLGTPSRAGINISDNETTNGTNAISQPTYYVRMNYLDFLNREPDTAGL
ncbi:MAG: Calx-beta domain-containing protein, partial [Pyrinomonadaceae bacterium]